VFESTDTSGTALWPKPQTAAAGQIQQKNNTGLNREPEDTYTSTLIKN